MNQISEKINFVIKIYVQIAAMIMLGAAVYITIFWGVDCELSGKILWQIMGISLLCALCSLLLCSQKELSKREMLIREILHFLCVNIITLTGGFIFEWFYLSDWKMVIGLETTIICVYAVIMAINYRLNKKTADEMNRRLKKLQDMHKDDLGISC